MLPLLPLEHSFLTESLSNNIIGRTVMLVQGRILHVEGDILHRTEIQNLLGSKATVIKIDSLSQAPNCVQLAAARLEGEPGFAEKVHLHDARD